MIWLIGLVIFVLWALVLFVVMACMVVSGRQEKAGQDTSGVKTL